MSTDGMIGRASQAPVTRGMLAQTGQAMSQNGMIVQASDSQRVTSHCKQCDLRDILARRSETCLGPCGRMYLSIVLFGFVCEDHEASRVWQSPRSSPAEGFADKEHLLFTPR